LTSPLSSNIVYRGRLFSLDRLAIRSRRYRSQGAVLLCLLAVNFLFLVVFVTPVYRDMMAGEASLQATRAKMGQLIQYQKAQEAVADLEKTLLTQQELALLADRLPAMARRHQLAIPGVSYQTERQKEGEVRKISFSFKVSGRYSDIRRFIHEVEGLQKFLYIQDMAITSSDKDSDRLELQVGMVAILR